MPHGISYGVEYVIHLSEPIDQYDDLLPICTLVRSMLQMNKKSKQIIVLSMDNLEKRYNEIPQSRELFKAMTKLEMNLETNRKENMSIFLYHDVCGYSKLGKSMESLCRNYKKLQIHSEEEFQEIFTPEYMQQIIDLEKVLTHIQLTEEEQWLIDQVKSHPKLAGLIVSEGFELQQEWY